METKTKNSPTTSNSPKPRPNRQALPTYSAEQKAQAVLSVWTERCKAAEVCRQLKVNWLTFDQWQQRAMEGMLQALEPRVNLARGAALSPRLLALLEKRRTASQTQKLAKRLEQIQLANPPPDATKTP
jgi:transposase-like protein